MKSGCVIVTLLAIGAMMAVCLMVKFASNVNSAHMKENSMVLGSRRMSGGAPVLSLAHTARTPAHVLAARFPYVAAVAVNTSAGWVFSCFGSLILKEWVVTSAHCRRVGFQHQVILYHDFAKQITRSYPVLTWRIHKYFVEKGPPSPKFDIAIAKISMDTSLNIRQAVLDQNKAFSLQASVWKTVATMEQNLFLTDAFSKMDVKISDPEDCMRYFGVFFDDSLICGDFSSYEDCFTNEFGPVFYGDKIAGVLAVKPKDCDTKFAVFTNVSFYSDWIKRSYRPL